MMTTSMIEQRNTMQISFLAKTTDPSQFADMVRQGVEMDLTCVRAVPEVLNALNIDIPKLVINVHVDGSKTYRFGTLQTNSEDDGVVIDLVLRDNHYQLRGLPEDGQRGRDLYEGNNCLFDALTLVIPQLSGVTGSEFRRKLADCIETNLDIRRHIQLGKHQALLQCGVYGGVPPSRRRSNSIHEDPTKETSAAKHLIDRFETILQTAAIIQYCSEMMGIPRDEVLCEGASRFQDRHSSDPNLDAAHVTRMQIVSTVEAIQHSHPILYEALKDKLGYTDLVEVWANRGGVGLDIDLMQGDLISLLEVIDFNQNPPTLMQNYSLAKLQKVIEKINKRLQKRNPNSTVITLPNTITATSIAGICREAYTAVLQNRIDIGKGKVDEVKNDAEDFVGDQLEAFVPVAAIQDAQDAIRKKDLNKLLKPSKAEEFILKLKERCAAYKDKQSKHFKRDDEDTDGNGSACGGSSANANASRGGENPEKGISAEQLIWYNDYMARNAPPKGDSTMKKIGCSVGVIAGVEVYTATAATVAKAAGFGAAVAWPVTAGVAAAVGTGIAVYGVCRFAMSLFN